MKEYKVHYKENIYFAISALFSAGIISLLAFAATKIDMKLMAGFMVFFFYIIFILAFFYVTHALLIGYLKANAVRITEKQFPEIYGILTDQCSKLGMKKKPTLFLIESGGILNAFATRFFGRNFVVIYSDIMDVAFTEGRDAVEFIIGHELGHIKRNHLIKRFFLLPSFVVPFLSNAYSRSCEYTCDNIGKYLSESGSVKGMLILAAGKNLYTKINVEEYLHTYSQERGFWKWMYHILASHPPIPLRIGNLT